MPSAFVDDLREWGCSLLGGAWAIDQVMDEMASASPHRPIESQASWARLAQCHVDGRTVLIIYALSPALGREERHSLARAAPAKFAAPILIVNESSAGYLRVDTSFCSESDAQRMGAFAAAAVVQASWAWDESPRISHRERRAVGRSRAAPRRIALASDDRGLTKSGLNEHDCGLPVDECVKIFC